jgi:hypothetical protein
VLCEQAGEIAGCAETGHTTPWIARHIGPISSGSKGWRERVCRSGKVKRSLVRNMPTLLTG